MSSTLGPYSTSSALSTTHYKLVESLEAARAPSEHDSVLDECILKIRDKWSRTLPTPSQAYKDLILILYCYSQRSTPTSEGRQETQEWVLMNSVRLAGSIGVGTIRQRQLGYRACVELFPKSESSDLQSLKLMLINTLRADLYSEEPDLRQTIQRWKMALKAIASEQLVTLELVPAVEERVFELLLREEEHDSGVRELAFHALVSLVKVNPNSTNLLHRARQTILYLLATPFTSSSDTIRAPDSTLPQSGSSRSSSRLIESRSISSASSTTSSRTTRQSRSSKPNPLPVSFNLALLSHLSPKSPLYPLTPSHTDSLALYLPLLDHYLSVFQPDGTTGSARLRTTNGGMARQQKSVHRNLWEMGFGFERFLRYLHRSLESVVDSQSGTEEAREEGDGIELGRVEEEIKARLETILVALVRRKHPNDQGTLQGLIFALVETLSTLYSSTPPSLSCSAPIFSSGTLAPLLSYLDETLSLSVHVRTPNPNSRILALRILAMLPVSSWTEGVDGGKGKGKARENEEGVDGGAREEWGEATWRIIVGGLRDRDENVRRATIGLLSNVDQSILSLHYSQTISSLTPSQFTQQRSRTIELLLELLPYSSSATHDSSIRHFPTLEHLVNLLRTPSLELNPTSVIPEIVLTLLNDFKYKLSRAQQCEFASGLWESNGTEEGVVDEFRWKGNVMLGLLVAGTVHRTCQKSQGEEGLEKARELSSWLINDAVNREVQRTLLEPFLFALLRLTSLSLPTSFPSLPSAPLNPRIPSILSEIKDSLSLVSSTANASETLDPELLDIAQVALSSSATLEKLRSIGRATEDESLAEFGEALTKAFEHNTQYSPYAHSSTIRCRSRSRQASSRTKDHGDATTQDEARIDEISRSIAALRREQAELKRERQDRGGTGGSGQRGRVESLMRDGTREIGLGERAREESLSSERSDSDAKDSQGDARERERETTFSTDGNGTIDEPPTSLLIELTETLDPFHTH